MTLNWKEDIAPSMLKAEMPDGGCYLVHDNSIWDRKDSSWGAFYRPRQGRSRFPKDSIPIGGMKTKAAAMERCEQHARACT